MEFWFVTHRRILISLDYDYRNCKNKCINNLVNFKVWIVEQRNMDIRDTILQALKQSLIGDTSKIAESTQMLA